MPLRIGIDVGGTFTDLVAYDPERRELHEHKILTTSSQPSLGILTGLRQLLERGGYASSALEAATIIHGTTLVANALIERKGASTALITTDGARDILETGKENRYDPYDRLLTRPSPLVPRRLRRAVGERLSATGAVVAALDEDEVSRVLQELVADGVEAVAVCFLHSYQNPVHEHLVRSIAASLGLRIYLSLSSDIDAEIGEFERVTATAANATIQPIAE
ncbi:MAG: hypothetical protein JSV66_19105, partial [Trueperaceae bacterium]